VKGARVLGRDLVRLREQLSPRDLAVLDQVRDLKLMTGAQIQAVHFRASDHETADAAGRACRRVLKRLVRDRLLTRLERRVGGIRGGSAGYIYVAAPLGYRVLDGDGPRRRFKEPSVTFVDHTLAITGAVVDLIDTQASLRVEILRLEPEPRCWRTFTSAGAREVLRPDLFVALGVGEYEHHSFVEIDLGTETLARRLVKCAQYERYYRSGEEQAARDLFPRVVWAMPTEALAEQLRERIERAKNLRDDIFAVTTYTKLLATLSGGPS
jgi:hypothetical protein